MDLKKIAFCAIVTVVVVYAMMQSNTIREQLGLPAKPVA